MFLFLSNKYSEVREKKTLTFVVSFNRHRISCFFFLTLIRVLVFAKVSFTFVLVLNELVVAFYFKKKRRIMFVFAFSSFKLNIICNQNTFNFFFGVLKNLNTTDFHTNDVKQHLYHQT